MGLSEFLFRFLRLAVARLGLGLSTCSDELVMGLSFWLPYIFVERVLICGNLVEFVKVGNQLILFKLLK